MDLAKTSWCFILYRMVIRLACIIVCTGLPAFAETLDVSQQPKSADDSHPQDTLQETEFSGDNSNPSKNPKDSEQGKFDRGAFDPLNETLPGELGEEESSSVVDDGSILPGENAEQFKEDDMEPREREGFLRTLPGGLN